VKRLALIIFLLSGICPQAWATIVVNEEICGDGIDNKQQYLGSEASCPTGWMPAKVNPLTNSQTTNYGCDLKCPTPDADNDGFKATAYCSYPSEQCDVNDNDRFIHPGSGLTTDGCSGGQVHTPQADGTYDACAAFACPAGRTCYYVSQATGSTANAGTSYASPAKNLTQFSNWASAPGFTVTVPSSNALIYLIDNGTYTDVGSMGGGGNMLRCNSNAASNVTVSAYPGTKPVLNNTAGGSVTAIAYLFGCGNWEFVGIQGISAGEVINSQGTRVTIRNLIGTAPLAGDDNHSCVQTHTTTNSVLQSAILYDCYKPAVTAISNNPANNSNFVTFRDVNLQIKSLTSFYTTLETTLGTAGTKIGTCAKIGKHSNYISSATVSRSVFFNCAYDAISFGLNNLTISRTRVGYSRTGVNSTDLGGPTFQQGQLNGGYYLNADRNTIWQITKTPTGRSPSLGYNALTDTTTSSAADGCSGTDPTSAPLTLGKFRVSNSYLQSINASYNQDNRFFTQNPYGPAALTSLSTLEFVNNTLSSPNATLSFGIAESNSGCGASCTQTGCDGQSYDFTQWQAAGYDTSASGSSVEDCLLDEFQRCTRSGTTDTGWVLTSEESSTTTTTTSTTTTTTLASASFNSIIFPQN
jgi:hypothetical protein